MRPFPQRLQELGYAEERNLTLDYRSAEGSPERLPQLAAELVQAMPDVLVAGFGTVAAKAAAAATKTIPVVFTGVGDPVGAGLVGSLGRPDANVTGMSALATETAAKQLQFLEDLVPGKRTFAVLCNPDTPYTALALREVRSAATDSNQSLLVFGARSADQVTAGIEAAIKARAAGLLTLDDPVLLSVQCVSWVTANEENWCMFRCGDRRGLGNNYRGDCRSRQGGNSAAFFFCPSLFELPYGIGNLQIGATFGSLQQLALLHSLARNDRPVLQRLFIPATCLRARTLIIIPSIAGFSLPMLSEDRCQAVHCSPPI